MRKLIWASAFFAAAICSHAQPSIIDVINTERSFAKTAIETNTRDAFLNFMADDGVVVVKGKIANAKSVYTQRKPDSSGLYWFPEFADVSFSGDLGYTSGPWYFKIKRTDEKPVAYGHFNTVWKKQSDGSWKAVIDLGITHPQPLSAPDPNATARSLVQPVYRNNGDAIKLKSELFKIEKEFTEAFNSKGNDVYKKYISDDVRIMREKHFPYTLADSIKKFIGEHSEKLTYNLIDGGIASSGDLAYVYGSVMKDQKEGAYYLRVWKREKQGWKIVLDVIKE